MADYGLSKLRETLVVREGTRRSMQSNTSTGTKPELRLRKALWEAGLRGYRKNDKGFPGKPDVYVPRARLAVFVHGCFWHGCERCTTYSLPKTNRAFWREKVRRNRERHARHLEELEEMGVRAVTVWECELKEDLEGVVARVMGMVAERSGPKKPPQS